jgi:hypothetical protein
VSNRNIPWKALTIYSLGGIILNPFEEERDEK